MSGLKNLARKALQTRNGFVQDIATYIVVWTECHKVLIARSPTARLTDNEKEFILRFHRVVCHLLFWKIAPTNQLKLSFYLVVMPSTRNGES